MTVLRDLTGQTFGHLLVVERAENKIFSTGKSVVQWRCLCECGNETLVTVANITSGHTTSCGCLTAKRCGETFRTHGLTDTRAYRTWQNMKSRCYRSRTASFKYYGAIGIRVCDRWKNSFEAFLEDMGHPPDGHSLERNDPTKDYEPSNCRWATALEQSRNRRGVRRHRYNGKNYYTSELADMVGISTSAMKCRLRIMSVKEAVETPRLRHYPTTA